ncbi:hypothetical protein D3C73_994380 [compost metagenome]
MVGSQIPDIDTLLRFKNNATYIRNHRGRSHSLPALLLWTLLITATLSVVFQNLPVLHVGMWVGIAVCFHVFTDLFNTYGTQALRPFSEKWVSWNIIHIFDPFIFGSHLIAIFLWTFNLASPTLIFPTLYVLIGIYYIWRSIDHYLLEKGMYRRDPNYEVGDKYMLITTINLNVWNIVKQKSNGTFVLGEWKNNKIRWIDSVKCTQHPAIDASKSNENVQSFLYFSSFACAEMKEHAWGYEVRWVDVRYRHRKQYPFVAVIHMNHNLETLDSYVGWLSESRLEKKLRMDMY